jgi:hypothetical protein
MFVTAGEWLEDSVLWMDLQWIPYVVPPQDL